MNFKTFYEFSSLMEWTTEEPYDRDKKRRGSHWGDSAAGIIIVAADTQRILVNERSADVDGGRSFGIYGGGFWVDDEDEISVQTAQQVAIEELRQEAGIRETPTNVELLYDYHDEYSDWHYFTFLGVIQNQTDHLQGDDESDWESESGSGWYSLRQFLSLQPKVSGMDEMLRSGGKAKILALVNRLGGGPKRVKAAPSPRTTKMLGNGPGQPDTSDAGPKRSVS